MDTKYEAFYLPLADLDILRIADALREYPDKAKRLFQEINGKVKALEDMPYMWPTYQAKPEYRQMILEDHLLFYFVDKVERKVEIYHISYGNMDIPSHIKKK